MIRIKITHSYFFLFLIWNLFLAVIPFVITNYLISIPKLTKWNLFFWFCVWLLFLPNAPYIVTDLLHLKISTSHFLWLDILVITAFAFNGLILFYLSLKDMRTLLSAFMSRQKVKYLIAIVIMLTGFGVYLGRFLRYNSWEILSNPKYLFIDIINIITQPFSNKEAWLFTILFSAFLSVSYWIFNQIMNTKCEAL
jgi:uncharacterized membrane protein